MGISEEGKSLSVDSEEKNHARMKSPTSSATLTGLATANRSFLHGSDGRKTSSERSMNDRVIYATLDSLALKRTSLPLQLLPIDDANVDTVEKKEKIVRGDKRPHTNRKASPRRPSFKVKLLELLELNWRTQYRTQDFFGFSYCILIIRLRREIGRDSFRTLRNKRLWRNCRGFGILC